MKPKKIKENIFWVGAVDWDRRLFDSLIQLPDGTSYNSYLVYGKDKTALFDTVDPSKTDVLMSNLSDVPIDSHKEWVSDKVSNTVIIPYVSMHNSTQLMVDYLTESLVKKGITVERFNLPVTDIGKLAISLVDAATMVVGSPTVLAGAHLLVVSAVFLANALRPKLKFASIIGSYGWAGKMTEQIKGLMSNLSVEVLEGVVIKGMPKDRDYNALERLANDILNKHRRINIG